MLIQSHIHLAKDLHQRINENKEVPIKLNLKAFQMGSIIPDFNTLGKQVIPHQFQVANKRVLKLTDGLLRCRPEDTQYISYSLGVIVHYIADFFCLAHNDEELKAKSNIWKHLKYEKDLHGQLLSVKSMEYPGETFKTKEISHWLGDNHKQYLASSSGIEADALFIQEMTYSLCINLLGSMAKEEMKVA